MLWAYEEAYGHIKLRQQEEDPCHETCVDPRGAQTTTRTTTRNANNINTTTYTPSLKGSTAAATAPRETRSPHSGSRDIGCCRPARPPRRKTRAHQSNHTKRPPAFQ